MVVAEGKTGRMVNGKQVVETTEVTITSVSKVTFI
ncbi:protein of unknown function [Candidatus Nitrosacidococcus tergens]|uniref:Uncharacterized protein n=1 Tax=Candidatus Nitrosacidococcus tergens TaxID=553981 RepID=A0A7G1Q939_9GAMM|nr:protein of unknown function [Candidatus Nitrosacidococcus tergens]